MVLTLEPVLYYGSAMVDDATDDPRAALRRRIRVIESQIADIDERRPKLIKLLATYKTLLSQEEAVQGNGSDIDEATVPAFHPTHDNRSLADLIVRVLGTGPKTLEELKEIGTATWSPVKDSTFPGRAINFALVGLQKGGYVERKDGVWKLIPARAVKEVGHPR
jgi:hypothetical protein